MEAVNLSFTTGSPRANNRNLKADIKVYFKDERINDMINDISEYSYDRAMYIRRAGTKTAQYRIYNKMALFYLLKPSRLEPFEVEYYLHHKKFISENTDVILPNV